MAKRPVLLIDGEPMTPERVSSMARAYIRRMLESLEEPVAFAWLLQAVATDPLIGAEYSKALRRHADAGAKVVSIGDLPKKPGRCRVRLVTHLGDKSSIELVGTSAAVAAERIAACLKTP